jgi:hypothetical protein
MKQSLADAKPKFDLKFLLIGRPGTGKTHFTATYTKGPVHYYMFDPGGEKTVRKVAKELKQPLDRYSVDYFQDINKISYPDFWKQMQQDDKDGFFDKLAEQQGLLVFDSITKISQMILIEVAKKNARTLTSIEKPMRIQDWGMVTSWQRELISVIDVLPCAVAVTCHYITESNEDGAVIGEFPSIVGGLRYTLDNDFDEVYRLESVGRNYKFNFRGSSLYSAKSRVVNELFLNNITMDDLYAWYIEGKKVEK